MEVLIATAIVGMGLGALMTVNSLVLRLAKDTRETNAASLMLQARLEQMRNVSWSNMLSGTYLKDTLLAETISTGSGIPDAEVKVRISPYNAVNIDASTNTQPLLVKRAADGTTSIVQQGGDFSEVRLARVDVSISWTGANGRARRRESSTIISNNGISKNNLPPMGVFAGGIFEQPENGGPPVVTPTTTEPTPPTPVESTPSTGKDKDKDKNKDKDATPGNSGTSGGKSGKG